MDTKTTQTETSVQNIDEQARQAQQSRSETELAATPRGASARGPLAFMRRLFEDFDRALGLDPYRATGGYAFVPQIEVSQRDGELIVKCDLPGLTPQEVDVTVEDDALVISGERHSAHEENDENTWRCERSYGTFRRVIPLPQNADPESAEAHFVNGVLEIAVKAPPTAAKGRKIDIKTPAEKLTH